MKKMILRLGLLCFLTTPAFSSMESFLVKEDEKTLKQDGNCKSRYAPCSTFKIAISLMGYDAGILEDENNPEYAFQEGEEDFLPIWKENHTPKRWMKNSCVWYSQRLTKQLGEEKFKEYVTKFGYGNQDISGDKGQTNGLTHCWLSSSLEISVEEQVAFLQKLLSKKLPVSEKAHEMTQKILFVEDLEKGWQLYGKTGNGRVLNEDRTRKLDPQLGWFVGWIQKGDRQIVFACFIQDVEKKDVFASFRARDAAKAHLKELIQTLT